MFGDIETFQIRPHLWHNEVEGIGRLGPAHDTRQEATGAGLKEAMTRGVTLRVRDENDAIVATIDHRLTRTTRTLAS